MYRQSVRGNDSCHLRRLLKPLPGRLLGKSDKTVSKYHGPENQHANVPAEVEGKTGAKHEQHQAQERFSLFPPADQQTSPKGHQYASCDRTKYLAKVQDAAANHSGGNGGVHTELVVLAVRALEAAPFRVVNSNHWL